MANATFNAGIDYFGLVATANPSLKVKSSAENRAKQSVNGTNSFGDTVKVDSYAETAAPSAEYDVIAAITQDTFPKPLGTCAAVTGIENPVVLGSITISTQSGSAPTVSASGQMVQSDATTLRTYTLPTLSVSPRHRAQDILSAISIKVGTAEASESEDYGLESASFTFPVEFTLTQPKGEVVGYDLHGGTATGTYTMNWYNATKPTIALTSAATTAGYTMSAPVSKTDPENGYTQYTWTVSLPLVGTEAA